MENPISEGGMDLIVRVKSLFLHMCDTGDSRLAEILGIFDRVIMSPVREDDSSADLDYSGCSVVFSYVEGKYPDLHGFLQKKREL